MTVADMSVNIAMPRQAQPYRKPSASLCTQHMLTQIQKAHIPLESSHGYKAYTKLPSNVPCTTQAQTVYTSRTPAVDMTAYIR